MKGKSCDICKGPCKGESHHLKIKTARKKMETGEHYEPKDTSGGKD